MELYVQAFCRVGIGLLFAISGMTKLRNMTAFQQAIARFHILPGDLSKATALFFLSGELLVVILIGIGGSLLLPGFVLAILLLLIFCGALASVIVRRIHTSCNCFGSSEKPVTMVDIWRNAGFLFCAVAGCISLVWSRGARTNLGGVEWLFISLGALAFVLIWIQLGEIAQLFNRN